MKSEWIRFAVLGCGTASLLALASCGGGGSGGGSADGGTRAAQPPVNITFDLHSDPHPQALPLAQRREYFRRQLANATWLLDTVEPHGAKLSFLAVGEFYEFCVEATERDACLPVLRRLYASGGILGTHQHCQYQRGAHDWPDIANCYSNPAEADVRRVWADGRRLTDEAVGQALGLSDAGAIAAVNTACESHAQLPDARLLMEESGYTIREGGADQALVRYFGHVPWNPFRPSGTSFIVEDLSTKFVTVPQGMVIGQTGLHAGVPQDGRAPRKQAELLELLATWMEHERTGRAPKVWNFGWGVHTQDLDEGSESRAAVEALIPWLAQEIVAGRSPEGNALARFSGYIEVRDEYLAWEREHAGVSSFSYPHTTTNYAAYPYLEWANRYLHASTFDAELPAPEGVRAFRLTAGGSALVLALAGQATGTLDVSILGATVRRVDLASGAQTVVSSASVSIGPGPVVLCAPVACDAVLAPASTASGPGDGVPRPFAP